MFVEISFKSTFKGPLYLECAVRSIMHLAIWLFILSNADFLFGFWVGKLVLDSRSFALSSLIIFCSRPWLSNGVITLADFCRLAVARTQL